MVIIISIIIGIVMISSALFEMSESRKEIFKVLSEESRSLIETISLSSVNTLNSSYEIENLITERLLNNARLIRTLDSMGVLNRNKLISFADENHLYRINIFDKKGNRVLTNRIPEPGHVHPPGSVNRFAELEPILKGHQATMIIGLKEAEFSNEQRFAVAVSRSGGRGAIVINLDAKEFLEFRKTIGIGKTIMDMADNAGIEYIVLQDSAGILAASTGIKSLNPIESDRFLSEAYKTDSTFTRISTFDGHEVYEIVKRLSLDGDVIGLYRIGVGLEEIKSLQGRMYRRIIVITILLAAITIIVLSIIFTSQNLKTVTAEFNKFKTFAASVLQNMGEAVIVVDASGIISLYNKSAEKLFGGSAEELKGQDLGIVLNGGLGFLKEEFSRLKTHTADLQKTVELNGSKKYLSVNIAINQGEENSEDSFTVVIKDVTQNKILEEEAKRNEKLSAMGELASGVAHEIRNPLNAVGMIAQRLNKEFSEKENAEEYKSITRLLKEEVDRINRIITQFLNYAKPLDMNREDVDSGSFFGDIYLLFADQAKAMNIDFSYSGGSFNMYIDPALMKQTLINIVQNAFEAAGTGGKVGLKYRKSGNKILIEVDDNGPGISEEEQSKIFDLYYTSKKDGNGLGLSIAQKIVSQHGGSIRVDSKINGGTKFTIII